MAGFGPGLTGNPSNGGGGGGNGLTAEGVRDVVGDYIRQGTNITITKDDANDRLTISATGGGVSLEQVYDAIGAGVLNGPGIDRSVDDSANTTTLGLRVAGTNIGGVKDGGDISVDNSGNMTIKDDKVGAAELNISAGTNITFSTASNLLTISAAAIPAKATATDWAQRIDDSKYLTVLGAATMEQSFDNGTEWTGFAYVDSNPTAGQWTISGTNGNGFTLTFETTSAIAIAMDAIFGRNSRFRVTVGANTLVGRVDYAWRNGSTFAFKARANASETGDVRAGNATLHATGGGYEALKDSGVHDHGRLRGRNRHRGDGRRGRHGDNRLHRNERRRHICHAGNRQRRDKFHHNHIAENASRRDRQTAARRRLQRISERLKPQRPAARAVAHQQRRHDRLLPSAHGDRVRGPEGRDAGGPPLRPDQRERPAH